VYNSKIMNENMQKEYFDRLPNELRMPFQRIVFERLGLHNDPDRALTDGKIISEYIDDIRNVEVREMIRERKFEEAADLLIPKIKKEEELRQAA